MPQNEATSPAHSGQHIEAAAGFAAIPNSLCRLGSPLAIGVYARLASTPRIWMRRGSLGANEVSVSRAALADSTRATEKAIRGALAWLIASGYVDRCATRIGRPAVFRVLGARSRGGLSVVPATPSDTDSKGQGPASDKKGPVEGQVSGPPKLQADRGLKGSPQGERASPRAKVLKDQRQLQQPHPNPPADGKAPAPAGQGGGVASPGGGTRANGVNPRARGENPRAQGTNPRTEGTNPRAVEGDSLASDWAKAHRSAGRDVPGERANHPDRYRGFVLRKLLGNGDRDTLLRDMTAFALQGDGGGVGAFETWLAARRKSVERESAYAARHGLPSGDWKALAVPVDFNSN